MIAKPGDWLIVPGRTDHSGGRRGEIVAVRCDTGGPPYTVRWIDTDHTALVFPGPDALVISAAELAEADHRASDRITRVQAAITSQAR